MWDRTPIRIPAGMTQGGLVRSLAIIISRDGIQCWLLTIINYKNGLLIPMGPKKKIKEKTKRPLYLTNQASNGKTNIISSNKVDYFLPISPIISSQNVLIRPNQIKSKILINHSKYTKYIIYNITTNGT